MLAFVLLPSTSRDSALKTHFSDMNPLVPPFTSILFFPSREDQYLCVSFLGKKFKTQPSYNLLGLMRNQGSDFRKCSWLTQTIAYLEITMDKRCQSG